MHHQSYIVVCVCVCVYTQQSRKEREREREKEREKREVSKDKSAYTHTHTHKHTFFVRSHVSILGSTILTVICFSSATVDPDAIVFSFSFLVCINGRLGGWSDAHDITLSIFVEKQPCNKASSSYLFHLYILWLKRETRDETFSFNCSWLHLLRLLPPLGI